MKTLVYAFTILAILQSELSRAQAPNKAVIFGFAQDKKKLNTVDLNKGEEQHPLPANKVKINTNILIGSNNATFGNGTILIIRPVNKLDSSTQLIQSLQNPKLTITIDGSSPEVVSPTPSQLKSTDWNIGLDTVLKNHRGAKRIQFTLSFESNEFAPKPFKFSLKNLDSAKAKSSSKSDSSDFTSVDFTTENWLHDPLTLNFRLTHQKHGLDPDSIIYKYDEHGNRHKDRDKSKHKVRGTNYAIAGIRFLFEPQFGVIFQTSTNRLDKTAIAAMPKFGLESNLSGGWVAVQTFVIFPFPSVTYDSQSPILTQSPSPLVNNSTTVNVDFGYGGGLSFFDGILSIGATNLVIDPRSFNHQSPNYSHSLLGNLYYYFNIQTLSSIRKIFKGQLIKQGKK